MKKGLISAVALAVLAVPSAALAVPTDPGTYGTASPNAQCGTSASSGAVNAHNSVYGPNSSAYGQDGGSGVPFGGTTGANNSAVCGNN